MSTAAILKAPAPAARRRPQRYTIASGKGGVGKTWFAVTLAQALALQGQRVLLVDGDLGLANVDVQLGIAPHADLVAVVDGKLPIEDAVTAYGGGQHKSVRGGFDILAGRSGSGALATLEQSEIQRLARGLDGLERAYDSIVVDLGAGLDEAVVTFATRSATPGGSHTVLVVLTDEPTSLTDAYAFIKVVHRHAPETDLRVVVNRAPGLSQGKRAYQALEGACRNFLKFVPPLAGVVPEDQKVADAIRHQTALLLRHPQSKAGSGVLALAKGLQMDGGAN